MNINSDLFKLFKLVIENAEYRHIFVSADIYRYLSIEHSELLKKILSISYFETSKIDMNYVIEHATVLNIDSIYLQCFINDLEKEIVKSEEFWVLIEKIKAHFIKSQLIPIMLNSYETIIKAESEIETVQPISELYESISLLSGRTNYKTKTEADITDIRERLKIYSGEKTVEQKRFKTGYKSIDNAFGGFGTSELNVFMGASGTGKTTVLLNMGYQSWLNNDDCNVLFFSFEMPTSQVYRRLDSRILNIDYDVLKYGKLDLKDQEKLKIYDTKKNMFKVIDVPPKTPVQVIEEYILSSKIKPTMVILDYIGLMGSNFKRGSEKWEILDDVALTLKYLAKRYHISVITASQITTDAMKRKDVQSEGYQLYDLAGAKAIGDHSDLVIGLQYDEDLKIMSCSSAKYRDGKDFSFQLFVDPHRCYLYEIIKKR